jgi:hypothetical protein
VIHVDLPPPPSHYVSKVKARGEDFLRRTPHPSSEDWRKHNYWKEIHDYLYQALKGICMYCASWTPRKEGTVPDYTSIDHFIPKSSVPPHAYEWTNFRLCRSRLNHRKDNFRDVADPCAIHTGWFMLDFATFLITPATDLGTTVFSTIKATIDRLQLNSDSDYVNERIGIIRMYSIGDVDLVHLASRYPFIADQIIRQDFDTLYKPRLKRFFERPLFIR